MRQFIVALLFAVSTLYSCSSDNSVSGQQGTLRVLLTDAPVNLKEVWVAITSVEVHPTGADWKEVSDAIENLDLLTLKDREELLSSAALEDGSYTGIRLEIRDGHIIEQDNSRCNLKIPSEKIEVPVQFEIKEGKTTSVLLDFKGEESVHVVKAGASETCILRPVLVPVSVQHD